MSEVLLWGMQNSYAPKHDIVPTQPDQGQCVARERRKVMVHSISANLFG